MKGWVGLVGWPIADVWPTKWSSVQLAVRRRTGKVRRSKTSVLPLCYAANRMYFCCRSEAEDDRAAVAHVLLDYTSQGIVESLRDDFTHSDDVKSLNDYFACCCNVQLQLRCKFRHFIFVSGEMLQRFYNGDSMHRGNSVVEFKKGTFQAWKVVENDCGHGT